MKLTADIQPIDVTPATATAATATVLPVRTPVLAMYNHKDSRRGDAAAQHPEHAAQPPAQVGDGIENVVDGGAHETGILGQQGRTRREEEHSDPYECDATPGQDPRGQRYHHRSPFPVP